MLVLVLVGGAVASYAFWLSGFLWFGAVVCLVLYLREAVFNRNRYSLEALRDIEEKEVARRLAEEVGQVSKDADTVACPYCLQPYPSEMSVCPYCGR
jgi:uncharacterized paraquat-inducible protein A